MKLGKNFDNLGEICGELMISAVSSWYLRWALQFLSYSSNAGLHIHCRDSLKRLNPSQYPHSSHDHCRDSPSLSWYLVQRLTPSLILYPLERLTLPCHHHCRDSLSSPLSSPLRRLSISHSCHPHCRDSLSLSPGIAETHFLSPWYLQIHSTSTPADLIFALVLVNPIGSSN